MPFKVIIRGVWVAGFDCLRKRPVRCARDQRDPHSLTHVCIGIDKGVCVFPELHWRGLCVRAPNYVCAR